jgi:Tol biopolymer transport system component
MDAWLLFALLAAEPTDWQKAESAHLRKIRQVTKDFVRAGEGYFSPDGKTIIFQAEEKETGNPFYQIFTQDIASGRVHRVSPGVGKTTCAFFAPDGKKIIFASSHLDPEARKQYAEEYRQREEERKAGKRRRYKWDFDPHLDIFEANTDGSGVKRLTDSPGYDAEGSYSPDGKHIVFCSNRSGPDDLELYIMDRDGKNVRQLTHAPGCYNGGPFFSPDGKRVIFRSDRKKKDHLQLYVINVDGTGERALTDDLNWVQWGPYWFKDSNHIVYAGANHAVPGRPNYDLYWMRVDDDAKSASPESGKGLRRATRSSESTISTTSRADPHRLRTEERRVRLTYYPGADVLPVFSKDGGKILWTSTRNGESQLFMADFVPPKGE